MEWIDIAKIAAPIAGPIVGAIVLGWRDLKKDLRESHERLIIHEGKNEKTFENHELRIGAIERRMPDDKLAHIGGTAD